MTTATAQQRKEAPAKLPPLTRFATLDATALRAADGAESRTLTFPFSSEYPVERWYGSETLSHAPGAADLARLNDGAPLLFNHNMDDVIGVVETAWIDSAQRKGYCTVRFANTPRADEMLQMVRDGILRNVSFMYRVANYQDMGDDNYIGTEWTPLEVTLASIPADPTVGIGRAPESGELPVRITRSEPAPQAPAAAPPAPAVAPVPAPAGRSFSQPPKGNSMETPETPTQAGATQQGAPVIDINTARADAAKSERDRITEIEALCAAHNVPADDRVRMVREGMSIAEARGLVLNSIVARSKDSVSLSGGGYAPDLSTKEKARFSMIRAINASLSGSWKDAGFELEVSNDIAKRTGKSTPGFYMPTNLPVDMSRAADYAVGAAATGGALVATNLLAGNFIEVLRNKSRVMSLGATVLSGLVGNVDIPRRTSDAPAYWVGEQEDVTNGAGAFDKVSLSPKTIGVLSQITRQMLMQGTPDIEMLVRAGMLAKIALGIDLAALSGSGSSNQPKGIVNQAGVGSVVGDTNGAAITIDHLIDMETVVLDSNAPEDGLAYIANPRTVGALKKLKSTTGEYLWVTTADMGRTGTPGEINGYTVARTKQARSNLTKGTGTNLSELFFGAWSELLIGEWGVLEIQPNPYAASVSAQGGVELRALQSIDMGVRHGASFSVMSDAITG